MSDWQEAEERVEKAHELYERGRWEEALSELKAAIAINPYNGAWYFNLGLTLDMMDRYEEAITAYRRALEMESDDLELLNAVGTDCTRVGKHREAIEFFERIERIDPAYEACYCNRIIAYSELDQHDRAEEMFYLARQYKETCPMCLYNMGNSLFARGLYDRALWCWQQVLQTEPTHPQTHARMAEVFWAKGQLGDARRHFLEELRLNPGDIDTMLDLGELLMEMGQETAAAEKFRQVLELEPGECVAHFNLGILAENEGDVALALQQFKHVLRNDKTFPGAHLRIALIHHRAKDRASALYHANCELSGRQELDEAVLLELGNLLMDLHQLPGAQTAFQRALEMNAKNVDARHNLAVTLLLRGSIDQGIQECRKALAAQPKYMLAMYNLALAYMTQHDYPRARHYLKEALDIAPDDAPLRQLHRRWKVRAVLHRLRRTLPARRRAKRPDSKA